MSSSRRTSGEIHILAMLDGNAGGPRLRRFPALPAVFWYGAAGVGVCVLLATLAWLARIPAPAHGASPGDVAAAVSPPARQPPARQPPAPQPRTPSASDDNAVLVVTALPPSGVALPPIPPQGATIVDAPPTPAIQPTRMRDAGAGADVDADAAAVAHASPRNAMARSHPAPAGFAVSRAGTMRTAAHAPAPHRVPASPAAATTRARRATAPAIVDTDVALISAIIQHTSAHAAGPDAATTPPCADRRCGPRMPDRP